jgi:hypothetical protein
MSLFSSSCAGSSIQRWDGHERKYTAIAQSLCFKKPYKSMKRMEGDGGIAPATASEVI